MEIQQKERGLPSPDCLKGQLRTGRASIVTTMADHNVSAILLMVTASETRQHQMANCDLKLNV